MDFISNKLRFSSKKLELRLLTAQIVKFRLAWGLLGGGLASLPQQKRFFEPVHSPQIARDDGQRSQKSVKKRTLKTFVDRPFL
jgi:hypothetical protein